MISAQLEFVDLHDETQQHQIQHHLILMDFVLIILSRPVIDDELHETIIKIVFDIDM
jgi:hypothetical protein